jgi:hypothetical protein
MQKLLLVFLLVILSAPAHRNLLAQQKSQDACPRPATGSIVPEPEDLRSENGVLTVDLTIKSQR